MAGGLPELGRRSIRTQFRHLPVKLLPRCGARELRTVGYLLRKYGWEITRRKEGRNPEKYSIRMLNGYTHPREEDLTSQLN